MHNNRKADRNAKIGQDVKQATKMKVDRKNDQGKELQKMQKIGKEAEKLEKRVKSLQSLVKRQEKQRKSNEDLVQDCEDVGKWVEKILKELRGNKDMEKTIASEVKEFHDTLKPKSLQATDGLGLFLTAAIALLIITRQTCENAGKK